MTNEGSTRSPLELVRDKTSDLHETVESRLGDRFFQEEKLDKEQFLSLLKSFYRIYAPLEAKLLPTVRETFSGYRYEERTERLKDDFRTLGLEESEVDQIEVLPDSLVVSPEEPSELLGCLYVIEGSEMGNRVMRSRLDEGLPEDCLGARSFFRDKTEESTRQWQTFKELLNREVSTSTERERLVDSARDTFELFKRSFEWVPDSS